MKRKSRILSLLLASLLLFTSTFVNFTIAADPNAVWTTDVTNSQDANVLQYLNKLDVYLRIGASISGYYKVVVSDPSGKIILGSSDNFSTPRVYNFVDGQITSPEALGITLDSDNISEGHDAYRLWDLVAQNNSDPGFSDTPNNGGSYKVTIFAIDSGQDKSDTFKVQQPIAGSIVINKFLDASNDGIKDPDEIPLSDITFELYESDKLTLVSTSTTVDGKITFDNLIPGTYFLKEKSENEITTPDFTNGFLEVRVSEYQTTTIDVGNYIPPEPDPKASITIDKFTDLDGEGDIDEGDDPLDGIQFNLYTKATVDNEVVYTLVRSGITGDGDAPDGQVKFIDLPLETYYLSENSTQTITAPADWSGIYYEISLTEDGQNFELSVGNYTPPEPDPKASITIDKFTDLDGEGDIDEGDDPLDGIQFNLYTKATVDNEVVYTLVRSGITGDGDAPDGQVKFIDLPLGTYYLSENSTQTITAPADWIGVYYEISLSEDGQNFELSVGNYTSPEPEPKTPDISITKTTNGSDGSRIPVGTAITWEYKVETVNGFDIYDVDVTDSDPNLNPVYDSGDDGDGVLEPGETWIFRATGSAVSGLYENIGYVTGNAEREVTVSDQDASSYTGYTVTTNTTTRRTPDPDPGNIEIFKFLDSNGDGSYDSDEFPFSKILFQLYDSAKKLIDTASTNNDGIALFTNLDAGNYFIKEVRGNYTITTHDLDDDGMIAIKVEEDKTAEVTIGNYREVIPPQEPPLGPPPEVEEIIEEKVPQGPPLPQTGEIPPYFAYGFGSLLVLAGAFMRRKF